MSRRIYFRSVIEEGFWEGLAGPWESTKAKAILSRKPPSTYPTSGPLHTLLKATRAKLTTVLKQPAKQYHKMAAFAAAHGGLETLTSLAKWLHESPSLQLVQNAGQNPTGTWSSFWFDLVEVLGLLLTEYGKVTPGIWHVKLVAQKRNLNGVEGTLDLDSLLILNALGDTGKIMYPPTNNASNVC